MMNLPYWNVMPPEYIISDTDILTKLLSSLCGCVTCKKKTMQRVSHHFCFIFTILTLIVWVFLHKITNTSSIHCFSSSFCSTCSSSQRSSIGMRSPACSQKSGSEAPSGSPAARGRSMSTAYSFHVTVQAYYVIFVGKNTLQITNKWQKWTLAGEVWYNSLSGFNVNFSFGWDLLTPTETLFLVTVCMLKYKNKKLFACLPPRRADFSEESVLWAAGVFYQ